MDEAVVDEAVARLCDRCSGRAFTPTSRTLCGPCLVEVDGADEPKQVVAGDWLKKEIPRRIEEAEAAGAPLPIFTGMMNAFLGKGK